MKPEKLIRANLDSKLGIWKSGANRSERLKEHIRMLYWVLEEKDVMIKTIEDIEFLTFEKGVCPKCKKADYVEECDSPSDKVIHWYCDRCKIYFNRFGDLNE